MNNEIKEIDVSDLMELLETTSKKEFYRLTIDHELVVRLYNYITNLQQEIKEANDSITWWNNRFKAVERENEELKKNQRYYKNGAFSLEYDKETLSDMVDDYKSRCEKAVKYIDTNFCIENCRDLKEVVNILQNGSDVNE